MKTKIFSGLFLLLLSGMLGLTSVDAKPATKKKAADAEMSPLQKSIGDLRSKDAAIRLQAAEELGRLRDVRAIPPLLLALSDADENVRSSSARTLGLMRTKDASKELSRLVTDDPTDQVRQSAVVALGFIADETTVPSLVKALKDAYVGVRYAACQALATLRAPEAVPPLIDLLKDADPKMRRNVALSLGQIGNSSAVIALRQALKDDDTTVQAGALQALGMLKDAESLPVIKKFLGKKMPIETRAAAVDACAKLGVKDGQSAALDIYNQKTIELRYRAMAVQSMALTGDKTTIATLEKAEAAETDPYLKQVLRITLDKLNSQIQP
ncbi:MAG TPA: HEAT repeat domain-containing protein [Elusimicrobiota bacterium]|nr:HEAT repeat domain-containing protein [Elusimicrobiota bacterium]